MKNTCDDCGRVIKRGEWYWYRITYAWDTGKEINEIMCTQCIHAHLDGGWGSPYGWECAYNGTPEKDDSLPRFHRLCKITTKDGQEYTARLIKLTPGFHTTVKEPRIWRREDAPTHKGRYIKLEDVIAWREEEKK